jgi:outer membrane protein TolC
MKKTVVVLLLAIVPCALAGITRDGSLNSVVAEAVSANFALKAARLRWESLQERPKIVGALPDPMVTYGYFFREIETRAGPTNQKFVGSQKFPFPGKRSLAASKAETEATVAMWEYQTQERSVILEAKLAYHELQQVAAMRSIFRDELQLLSVILQAATARYETGMGEQQEILKVSLATNEVRQRLLELNRQERTTLAQLNALSGNPPQRAISVDRQFVRSSLPPEAMAIAVAEVYRQELQAAGVATKRDEISVSLAEKNRWPDVSIGVEYIEVDDSIVAGSPDSGDDTLMGFISFNLPIWRGKLRAEKIEAERRLAASREIASDMRTDIIAEVNAAWFHAKIREEQIELYDSDLIPLAERSLESAQAGYRAARVGFLDVLDSQRVLLSLRLGLVTADTDFAKSLARLERSVGVDLERIPHLSLATQPAVAGEGSD